MCPARSTARDTGASLFNDRCVRTSLYNTTTERPRDRGVRASYFRFPLRQIREAGSELGCGIANRKGRRIVTRIEAACDPAYELFGKLVATHVGGEDQDGANGSARCAEHNRAQPHPDRTVLFRSDASLRRGYAITITRGDDHRAIHAAQALA